MSDERFLYKLDYFEIKDLEPRAGLLLMLLHASYEPEEPITLSNRVLTEQLGWCNSTLRRAINILRERLMLACEYDRCCNRTMYLIQGNGDE